MSGLSVLNGEVPKIKQIMLEIEDLKSGEIYKITFKDRPDLDSLFRFTYIYAERKPGLDGKRLYINRLEYENSNSSCWSTDIYSVSFERPNPENFHWFLECEKAGKFIPKDEAMKSFNTIPEYVECIKIDCNLEIGKIYKIESYDNGEKYGKPVYFINKLPYYATYFKPSTKEAFDLQNNPVVNEFKVGEYWFYREGLKQNDLYKIVKSKDIYLTITGISSRCKHIKNSEYNKEVFKNCGKWFKAKLEEIPVESLTDDELLEVAKQYFPIETEIRCIYGDKLIRKIIRENFSIGYANSDDAKTVLVTCSKNKNHDSDKAAIWSSKKGWAEIVSNTPINTECVEPLNAYYGKHEDTWETKDPNEIIIPKVVKTVKKVDFNIEKPTFAEIKLPINNKPKKTIKPIKVEKFQLTF